ncbi:MULTISPECIES: recombinase family protein [unclassified Caulobacter]|uniref:recombinase family protein n=1 Tax=unclassified Caulobacter TaxID=2648921 RepID=UPI000D332C7B|nr:MULTISPECIES: recombinase family protein [unclassified Caulobacter]PTS90080.1 recombinase [Caulobacter sp. HMWF009]PTT04984.1 recombinase [Caulobacter sp. HMWF025]
MKIGFSRVSTSSQDHALQIDALEKAGCERIFLETVSGTRIDRPELAKALEFARPGDVLCVFALSRLGRNMRQIIDIVDDLNSREIGLHSLTENIETSSPTGRLWVNMLAALNQAETDILKLRTRHGLAAARARGRVGGRPRSLDDQKLRVAKALIAEGTLTVAEVAGQVGCAPATLYRALPGGRTAMGEQRV